MLFGFNDAKDYRKAKAAEDLEDEDEDDEEGDGEDVEEGEGVAVTESDESEDGVSEAEGGDDVTPANNRKRKRKSKSRNKVPDPNTLNPNKKPRKPYTKKRKTPNAKEKVEKVKEDNVLKVRGQKREHERKKAAKCMSPDGASKKRKKDAAADEAKARDSVDINASLAAASGGQDMGDEDTQQMLERLNEKFVKNPTKSIEGNEIGQVFKHCALLEEDTGQVRVFRVPLDLIE